MSVESPCISVCELDENDVCKGCFRTLEEIGQWPLANNDQRKEFLLLSEARYQLAFSDVSGVTGKSGESDR